MKLSVMTSPGRIEFRDVPVPQPGAGEVLIRMKRIGVCGSDIHVYHGKHALTPYPVVQGHEVSGIIDKVGVSVREFAPGDAVTIQPQVTCGTCYPCTHGAYHIRDSLKVMGFQTTGAGSEYFAVGASKVPGSRQARPDWKKAIDLVEAGAIRLEPLITDHFEFADYKKAYEYIEANRERAMKVMIVVDK